MDVYRSKARTLNEVEQQVPDPFTAVPLDVLRKSVASVFSTLQKCVQNAEILQQTVVYGL